MTLLLAALAWAAEPQPTSPQDRIAGWEWERAAPAQLRPALAEGDTATRLAALRALGRLRSPDAVQDLVAWRDDPDPAVRVAVAQALGWTPGGAEVLRAWWWKRGAEPVEVVTAVTIALGRAGDTRDVQQLVAALLERGAAGTAAARAIGILASRGTTGLEVTFPALVARLDTIDDDRLDAVAWALARIRKPLPRELLPDVLAAVGSGASPEARAWLLKAAWPTMSPTERESVFLRAMTDSPRLVQTTVMGVLEPDDAMPEVLAGFLLDPDPWVRYAAIDALGRHPDPARSAVLRGHLALATDPWEQARVVRALREPDPSAAADAALPVVVRAAWVEGLPDPAELVRYAAEAPEPMIRSAAVGAWMEREPTAEAVRRLAAAGDPVVRQVAADRAAALPPKVAAPLIRDALATETDPAVSGQWWRSLAAVLEKDRRSLAPGDRKVKAALAALGTGEAPVLAAAASVARALALPRPAAEAARPPAEREVPVGAEVVRVPSRPADLAAVRAIRGARVRTDRGEFVIALDPDRAPLAVATFAALAEGGYYDGLVFHRVVPGFVVQTGCPRGDGWGGPGFVIPDEDSEVPFGAGAVGMAREDVRDSGGSQWFVVTADQPHLTSEYTRFGEVVQGLWVAQQLPQGAVIESVAIERVAAP